MLREVGRFSSASLFRFVLTAGVRTSMTGGVGGHRDAFLHRVGWHLRVNRRHETGLEPHVHTLDRCEPGQLERERIDTAGKGREAIAPFGSVCAVCVPPSNAGLAIDTVTPGRIARLIRDLALNAERSVLCARAGMGTAAPP